MTDPDFYLYAFKGNEAARDFAFDLIYVANIWDDLIDRDHEVTPADINTAFAVALVGMPRNPFFQRFASDLLPVMSLGITNFLIANQFERGSYEDRVKAHGLRYSAADTFTHMATLIGGMSWAEEVGPELRRRAAKEKLNDYLQELDSKYPNATSEGGSSHAQQPI